MRAVRINGRLGPELSGEIFFNICQYFLVFMEKVVSIWSVFWEKVVSIWSVFLEKVVSIVVSILQGLLKYYSGVSSA